MSLYAFTQDLPIDAAIYAEINARIGDSKLPGLLVHVAVEKPDGRMHYIDVWESEQACDEAFRSVIHPAVHPVITARGVVVAEEPARIPLNVVDVRYGDGTSVQA